MVCAVALAAVLLGAMPAAEAGGNSLSSLRERYEAGDVVTLIGYTSSYFAEDIDAMLAGATEVPALHLYRLNGRDTPATPLGIVGRPLVEATGHPETYAYRVSIAFRLPVSTPPGEYLLLNNQSMVGDLMDARFAVGIHPTDPYLSPELAFDDPALTVLSADVRIRAYPRGATVGELRRGVDPGTDAWLRRPVQWPLPVIDVPAAMFEQPLPAPTTTVPVVPTTMPVTTAASTTVVPTTISATEPTPTTDSTASSTDDASDLGAVIAVAAIVLVFAGAATVLALRARRNYPTLLAQFPQHEAVKCTENGDPAADHDAEVLATVS